jgi:hypothetical protein
MSKPILPEAFADLAPWVAEWSIPHEDGRFAKRVSSTPDALNAFVNAVFPRVEAIVAYVNQFPTSDPDTLEPADRRLFDLALMCMEGVIPSDLDWDRTDIEDAWPRDRMTFMYPSVFPEPGNRVG